MLFEPHCKAATGEVLPSPAVVGATPSVPVNVDVEADSTPRGGTGVRKRGNKQLATRTKAAKRRRTPILVSSSHSTPETLTTRPIQDGSKYMATRAEKSSKSSASTVAAVREGNDSVHVPKSGLPPEITPLRFFDSPNAPSIPPKSRDLVQAPILSEQTGDAGPALFCSRSSIFNSWLRQQPIPASLEELLRLFVSWRQRQINEDVMDAYASYEAGSPPKWHRPGGYDK